MISLYLIVSVAVSQCPAPIPFGNLTVTPAVYTFPTSTPCQCIASSTVAFTTKKDEAEKSLEGGARVWRIGYTPHAGIVELRREAKTTFSIIEATEIAR